VTTVRASTSTPTRTWRTTASAQTRRLRFPPDENPMGPVCSGVTYPESPTAVLESQLRRPFSPHWPTNTQVPVFFTKDSVRSPDLEYDTIPDSGSRLTLSTNCLFPPVFLLTSKLLYSVFFWRLLHLHILSIGSASIVLAFYWWRGRFCELLGDIFFSFLAPLRFFCYPDRSQVGTSARFCKVKRRKSFGRTTKGDGIG